MRVSAQSLFVFSSIRSAPTASSSVFRWWRCCEGGAVVGLVGAVEIAQQGVAGFGIRNGGQAADGGVDFLRVVDGDGD